MFGLLGEKTLKREIIPHGDAAVMLACFTLLLLPHIARLPWAVDGYLALMISGRFWLSHRVLGLPGWKGKAGLILLGVAALWVGLGWQFTVNSAVALFIVSISLKLYEVRFLRDVYAYTLLLLYFTGTAFLFDQSLQVLVYLFSCLVIIFYLLLRANTVGASLTTLARIKRTGKILLQAVPVMVVLFLFFPRIAPLWSVPLNSGQARTGISDSMAPGDISELAQSDELAFRAEFVSDIPEKKQLYWRGLVLDQFDGRVWSSSEVQPYAPIGRVLDVRLEEKVSEQAYKVVIEPTEKRWAFTLDDSVPASNNIELSPEGLIRFRQNVFQPTLYQADIRSDGISNSTGALSDQTLKRYLSIPKSTNPQAQKLAKDFWEEASGEVELFLKKLLERFHTEPYVYTLRPPASGEHSIDDFLFNNRKGFCAHYAGSLAFMTRSVGVPSRIIVGYQGGELSQDGSYLVIHQYDAHAWVEVWLKEKGWVRVDPTSYVSPARIEAGIRDAVKEEGSFLEKNAFSASRFAHIGVISWLRWQLDAVNYNWQKWVVGYNEDLQSNLLLQWFNDDSLLFMASALVALSAIVFVGLFLWNYYTTRKKPQSEAVKLYDRFCAVLAKMGIERLSHEGPEDFAVRAIKLFPAGASVIQHITKSFVSLQYRLPPDSEIPTKMHKRSEVEALNGFRLQVRSARKQLMRMRQRPKLRRW